MRQPPKGLRACDIQMNTWTVSFFGVNILAYLYVRTTQNILKETAHARIPHGSGTAAQCCLAADAALARLSQWIDHGHPRHLRQTQLPLSSAQPAWARPQLSFDPQGEGKDRHRKLYQLGRTAQGTTRSGDLSPLSSTGARVVGDQRKDLPGSTRRTGAKPVEKKRRKSSSRKWLAK
jgi:hypothetical protein